jgi:peptidoglycan/LPS O-acetylase OafA/YrhL
VTFYVTLPLYATALWRLGRGRRALSEFVGVSVLFVSGLVFTAWSSFGNPPGDIGILPANLAPFALGMFLAVAHSWSQGRSKSPRWTRAIGNHPGVSWLVAAVAWSAIVWAVHYPAFLPIFKLPGHQTLEYTLLLDVTAFFLVAPMVLGKQSEGLLRRSLQLRPVVFLGTISYAIYLWHVPAMYKIESIAQELHLIRAEQHFNFFAITALTLAFTIPLAIASWYFIEKPLIQLSHHGARENRRSLMRGLSPLVRRLAGRPTAVAAIMGDEVPESANP